jgi:prephenate dehydrogenase
MDEPSFTLRDATIAIVGLGLMGGSLALALRAKNACARILGIEREAEPRAQALVRGVVDRASADLSLASEADVIVLATPVRTIVEQLPRVGTVARAGAMVMDLGSTKRQITRAMEALPAPVQVIGAHPMCGKETAGFEAADSNLFHAAAFVLTPLARTPPETLTFAQSLVRTLGARPVVLDAARHDKIVAAISHLPFTLAATLMTTAADLARDDDMLFTLAASGYRDVSRLSASDTTMMLDALLTNRENVAASLRTFSHHLGAFADALEGEDETTLRQALEDAASQRRGMLKNND